MCVRVCERVCARARVCGWAQACSTQRNMLVQGLNCSPCDESAGHIVTHNFQHRGLDVLIGDALDVAVADLLVPYLQRFAAY